MGIKVSEPNRCRSPGQALAKSLGHGHAFDGGSRGDWILSSLRVGSLIDSGKMDRWHILGIREPHSTASSMPRIPSLTYRTLLKISNSIWFRQFRPGLNARLPGDSNGFLLVFFRCWANFLPVSRWLRAGTLNQKVPWQRGSMP